MLNLSSLKRNRTEIVVAAVFIFFCLINKSLSAGDYNYPCDSIPGRLLENSNAVIRFHEISFDIQSEKKATMKVHYVISVLKNAAVDKAFLLAGYNRFTKIKHIKGTVYNEKGERVERIEQDQFYDFSAIQDFSTYEDNRIIFCKPRYQRVPFTVEYSYEVDFNGILDYPDFYLVDDFNIAVQQSDLNISAPDSLQIKFLERNMAPAAEFEKQKSGYTYTWNFQDFPSLRKEPFSPSVPELSPSVLLAPQSFELKGRMGQNDDWRSFGSWVFELIKDRDDLSDETRKKAVDMTSGVTDTLEKIRILYHYLQNKTRYVSIQIGIGGWQPALASDVDELGYGDCKALTNYMKSLLHAAGIESVYTLVNAGTEEPEIYREFPSQQFNHIILCVPLKNDTIWLECTSQDIPMGYLGTFTDDRYVLLIREEGGFLARTPRYDHTVNIRNRSAHVQFQENGDAVMHLRVKNQGLFYDGAHEIILLDETDKRKKLIELISISDFVLDSFNLKENKSRIPALEENLSLTINKIGVTAGELMLFAPNQLSRETELSSQVIKRTHPVEIRRPMVKIDTIWYALPKGLSFTGNHIDQRISSKFGEYRAATSLEGQDLRYIRYLVINKGYYPKESYGDFLEFFEKVANADTKKIALTPLHTN